MLETARIEVPKVQPEAMAEISSADRVPIERRKSRQRSKVGNGTALLSGVDGRSAWVRRAKDILSELVSDMGGETNTSAAERHIARRATTMIVELERLERKFALAGEASADDLDVYARIASSMRRLLESIGLRRRPRDVTPDPLEYAARSETS
jgi:hypothetical protein